VQPSAVFRLIVVWEKQSVGLNLAARLVESHPRALNDVAPRGPLYLVHPSKPGTQHPPSSFRSL